jgi:hypothetical protein
MDQLFSDPKRPLLEQAVGVELIPLPLDQVAEHIAQEFKRTGRHAGSALQPLVEFTRGHPQRTMLLAHYLWTRTPDGATADEQTFAAAQNDALRHAQTHLRAIFKALKPNEKRVMLALANLPGSPREKANAAAVGLNPNSATKTLEGLRESADVFEPAPGGSMITDPLFELWLRRRGLTGMEPAPE